MGMKNNFCFIIIITFLLVFVFVSSCKKHDVNDPNIVCDIEGNTYRTVKIGNQTWMAENLKSERFANGSEIKLITDNSLWENYYGDSSAVICCYYDNSSENREQYGTLYNYQAASNVCPEGWHLPSIDEWEELFSFVINDGNANGGDLQSIANLLKSNYGWAEYNNGTDKYGFTALPGGLCTHSGDFFYLAIRGRWWTSTPSSEEFARQVSISSEGYSLHTYTAFNKFSGASVRCVKD